MARHIVTAPDGTRHEIEAPEGATPEQIVAFAQQSLGGATAPAAPVAAPKQASWGNVIGSAPYKALAGTADVLLNAPANVINLGKMAYGTAATALGRPDLAPNIAPAPDYARNALIAGGMITPTNNMSPAQRVVDVGLQTATGAALNPVESGRALAKNMLLGGTAGTAGQTTTEVTGSPLAGLAVTLATPGLIENQFQKMQAAAQIEKAKNVTRDATYTAGQKLGLQAPPGNVNPSLINVGLETTAGKINTAQNMAAHNQDVIDTVSRRAVGLPLDAPLTPETMKAVRAAEYTKGYEPVAVVGAVPTDNVFRQALADIRAKFTGPTKSFPGAAPDEVKKLTKVYDVAAFDAADALPAIQSLRDAAKGSFAKGDNGLGKAQIAASKALEDQIERSLANANNPQAAALLEQFRASRVRMAVSHAIEDAIQVGTGSVNGRQLASDIQRGKYLTGELADIAKFANTFKTVVKQPGQFGTPGAGTGLMQKMAMGTGATVGGGLGYALGGNQGAAAGVTLGAMGVPLVTQGLQSGARAIMESNLMQRNALPNYNTGSFLGQDIYSPGLRNALLTIPQTQNALAR